MIAHEGTLAEGRAVARPARRGVPLPLLGAGVVVTLLVALPAVYLGVRASELGWDGARDLLGESRTRLLLFRTFGLAAAVTASALAIAVPFAWLTVRSDLPLRRVLTVLLALPLAIPTYVGGYALVAAFGPRGRLQGWLAPLGVERLPDLYGFVGAWLALTLFTYPYAYLTIRAALSRLDVSLEEASRSLGVGRRATFRRVVLPQLRGSIGVSGLLVALYVLHDFGAVSFLRFDSFTRAIYTEYTSSFDRSRAAGLSIALVALAFVVLRAEAAVRGPTVPNPVPSSGRPASTTSLGRWRLPVATACWSFLGLAFVVPVAVLADLALKGPGFDSRLWLAARHSAQLAALGAALTLAAAWPVAMLSARHGGRRLVRIVERGSHVGYMLPGLVVALSLVFIGTRLVPAAYQTLWLLVAAYVVLFLPPAVGALRGSIHQISPSLEEAAATLGSNRHAVLWRVVLPLARPGMVAGYALVFLTAVKELPATVLLAPVEYSTLATRVWDATSAARMTGAALPALLLVALGAVPLAFSVVRERAGQLRG